MSESNKKSLWRSRATSFLTAGAIFATTLPWFQDGLGAGLAVVVHVWAWIIMIVAMLAIGLVGLGATILLWYSGELDWKKDREAFEKAAEGFTTVKPKWYWSIPVSGAWIFALASTPWTGLLGTYVVVTVLSWVVMYSLVKSLRETAAKLKAEWETEDTDKPEELRNL